MFNTKVTLKNEGMYDESKQYKPVGEAIDTKNQAVIEGAARRSMERDMRRIEEQRYNDALFESHVVERGNAMAVNNIAVKCKENVFSYIMCEMYRASLFIDKEFLLENAYKFDVTMQEYLNKNGGYSMLKEALKTSDSRLLKRVENLVENFSYLVANRIIRESSSDTSIDVSKIDFALTSDEKEELDSNKENLQLEEVGDVIKEKVKEVVKEEIERSNEEDDIEDDVNESDGDDDSDDSDVEPDESESTSEAFEYKLNSRGEFMSKNADKEGTLFNSLMVNTYLQVHESATMHNANNSYAHAEDEDRENGLNARPYLSKQDVISGEYDPTENQLEREVESHDVYQASQIDLDLVLADAVSQYTLYELCHTIKLNSLSRKEIRDYSLEVLNK